MAPPWKQNKATPPAFDINEFAKGALSDDDGKAFKNAVSGMKRDLRRKLFLIFLRAAGGTALALIGVGYIGAVVIDNLRDHDFSITSVALSVLAFMAIVGGTGVAWHAGDEPDEPEQRTAAAGGRL